MTRLDDKRDPNDYRDVRTTLEVLGQLLQVNNAACVGVTHFNKSQGPLENRVMGSRAWSAVTRSIICVHSLEEEDERVVTHAKCNHGPKQQSIRFGIKTRTVGKDEEDGSGIVAAHIIEHGSIDLSAREAMAAADNRHLKKAKTPADMACDWLESFFEANTDTQLELDGDGEPQGILRETIMAAAAKAQHSERTVARAAKELGVESIRAKGEGRKVLWRMPNV